MSEEKHHLGQDMKSQIEKEVAEKKKIAEGKKEFDKKRPSLQAEIAKKAQAHEKIAQEIEKGKKEFDAKKGELFKEIEKKVAKKK